MKQNLISIALLSLAVSFTGCKKTDPTSPAPATSPAASAAPATPAAPTPATPAAPAAATPIDLSFPASTLKSLNAALLAGDHTTAKACVIDDPDQQKYVDYKITVDAAGQDFDDNLKAQFPADADKIPSASLQANAQNALAPGANETDNGDSATIASTDGKSSFTFTRTNGKWLIDLAPNQAAKAIVNLAGDPVKIAAAIQGVTAQLKAGKFASAKEAEFAKASAMLKAR